MASSFNKVNAFVENLAEKVFNLGSDSLSVALVAAANAPTATDSKLGDLTEITYTNLSSRALTVSTSAQTGGTYKLVLSDLTLTASGGSVGPFRYIVIYDDTATNDEIIGYYDYGSEVTLGDGESITLDFDDTNGVLQLA